jgi:hypothetical protein
LLFEPKWAIFQPYHGENKLHLMRRCLLCTRPTHLVKIFIVLAHWNNSLWVDMSFHSDKLPWFRANQSSLFLLNAACLAEMQQISNINFIVFSLTYQTQGKNANHYTTNMVFNTRILLYDSDTLVYVWFVLLSTIFQLQWIHFYSLNIHVLIHGFW